MAFVTTHACERFLQRVLKFDVYYKSDVKRASHWLSQEIDLTKTYMDGKYPLPSFPEYVAVIHNNGIVTIRER